MKKLHQKSVSRRRGSAATGPGEGPGLTPCLEKLKIDAQPRGGNRQTAKRFCKVVHLQFVLLNFFKAIIGWDPPPAKLGAASNPPRRPRWCPPCAQPFFCMAKELCQWQLIGCYHFVMFITYNQLMWVFKVLFGYDCTPNKSVQPLFGSTNTDCTGLTDTHTDRLFMKTPTLSV